MGKKGINVDIIGKVVERSKAFGTDINSGIDDKTSIKSDTKIKPNTDSDTKPNTKIEISTNTSTTTNTKHDTIFEPNISTNIDTKLNTDTSTKKNYKAKKEHIKKVQRTYYTTTEMIDKLTKFCKKNKVDRSEIINEALTEFLEKYQ